jgi:4-hydroxy-3-methylbut-2-enyl diphosphate reductase
MIQIQIDDTSGFCSGVIRAISMAEDALEQYGKLYCLGNIVHNPIELARLREKGMEIIDYERYCTLKDTIVLIRAHGEPPHVFNTALENNLELLNATCPIVSRLQDKIKAALSKAAADNGTIIIFGKKEHPEVVALTGIAGGKATVVRNLEELKNVSLDHPVYLFAQTTINKDEYGQLAEELRSRIADSGGDPDSMLHVYNSICGEVACRLPDVQHFAQQYELILFVSGKESNNGKMLYKACKEINPNTWFISELTDLDQVPLAGAASIGISGATSTPPWLLEKVRDIAAERAGKN